MLWEFGISINLLKTRRAGLCTVYWAYVKKDCRINVFCFVYAQPGNIFGLMNNNGKHLCNASILMKNIAPIQFIFSRFLSQATKRCEHTYSKGIWHQVIAVVMWDISKNICQVACQVQWGARCTFILGNSKRRLEQTSALWCYSVSAGLVVMQSAVYLGVSVHHQCFSTKVTTFCKIQSMQMHMNFCSD